MKTDNITRLRSNRVWLGPESCDLDDFVTQISRTSGPAD